MSDYVEEQSSGVSEEAVDIPDFDPNYLMNKRMSRRSLLLTGAQAAAGLAAAAAAPGLVEAATSGARFKGVTLKVAVGSFMSTGVTLFTDSWQKRTGGHVDLVQIPFGDLYSKLFSAFTSHSAPYDIAIYANDWVPEFAKGGYVLNLEKYYKKKSNWNSVMPNVQHLMYVKGKRYTVPMDGDVIFGYYRKDAIDNPKHKAAFKKKFGYTLAPPETWKQYHDVAAFFTGQDWAGDGRPGYGVIEAMGPHDVDPYILTARAAAYAAHPHLPGSLFFDPATMKPQVNNPGWVRALEDWIAIKKFGPPQMTTYGGGDERGNFPAGDFALTIDWADTGVQAMDPTASKIRSKLGYFILPGSQEVYNYKTKRWDKFPHVSHAPYLGWGGWHGSVISTTKHADAAWDFLDWLDTTPNALRAVTTPGTARNPYRRDHFNPAKWTNAPIHYVDPKPYLDTIYRSMTHPNHQFDLRIPGAGQYFNALDKWLQLAISGQMPAQRALNNCATAWDKITNSFGRASQKSYYNSLNKR